MAGNKYLMSSAAPLALVCAAAISVPAFAADIGMPVYVADPQPVTASPAGFEGFYIGGHKGFGSAENSGVIVDGGPRVSLDNAGFLLGMHAGYNWAVSQNLYAGIEGDLSLMPWSGKFAGPADAGGSDGVFGHLTGISSIRGRLGYQMDRTLLYATGGVAFASSNAGGGQKRSITISGIKSWLPRLPAPDWSGW